MLVTIRCGEASWLVDAKTFADLKRSVDEFTQGLISLDPLSLEYKIGGTYCTVMCEASFQQVLGHCAAAGDGAGLPVLTAALLRPLVIPATGEEARLKQKLLHAYGTIASITHRSQSPKKRLARAECDVSDINTSGSSAINTTATRHELARPDLMVWGTDINRGVPVPFRPSTPPTFAAFQNQISVLLGVGLPIALTFRNDDGEGGLDADIEDDDDLQLFAELAVRVGMEHLSIRASSRAESSSLQKKNKVLASATPGRPSSASASKVRPPHSIVSQLD
jgi:hypothetical protein